MVTFFLFEKICVGIFRRQILVKFTSSRKYVINRTFIVNRFDIIGNILKTSTFKTRHKNICQSWIQWISYTYTFYLFKTCIVKREQWLFGGQVKVRFPPPPERWFYLLQWEPFQNDRNSLLFHLKNFFCS